MPSVRSRIKQFESLTGEDEKSEDTGKTTNKPAKKFLYPGHASQQEQQQRHSPTDHVINSQVVKQSGDQHHMSNKLEEVWSVRRNVGLSRNINPAPVTTTSHLSSNVYSRHGALPAAHHQYLPPVVNKKDSGESSFGRSRSPLQDHNQDGGRLRNIKAGGYSYSDAKRSHDLPPNFDVSSPGNKHKSIVLASLIRPNDNGLLPPVNQINDKKRRYAEKMAKAHLRSTGMGDYTPKGNTYAKLPSKGGADDYGEGPSSRWRLKSREDDEFDF